MSPQYARTILSRVLFAGPVGLRLDVESILNHNFQPKIRSLFTSSKLMERNFINSLIEYFFFLLLENQ